jgi:hypothetical protein
MPKRIVAWGNKNPFLMAFSLAFILVVVMSTALVREGNQRRADDRQDAIALAAALQTEADARAAAVIKACEVGFGRVETTFHEVIDYIRDRSIELRGTAPASLDALDGIVSENLAPTFCSPPILVPDTTTTTP